MALEESGLIDSMGPEGGGRREIPAAPWIAGLAEPRFIALVGKTQKFYLQMLNMLPEELIQEVIEKFLRDPEKRCQPERPNDAYILTACRNLAVDKVRRSSTRCEISNREGHILARPEPRTEDVTRRVEDQDLADWLLTPLDEDDRMLIHMKYYLCLPIGEIATRLKINVKTAGMRVTRAEDRMRDHARRHAEVDDPDAGDMPGGR